VPEREELTMPYVRKGLPRGFEWIRGAGRHTVTDDRGSVSKTVATVRMKKGPDSRSYHWTALRESGVVEGWQGLLKAKLMVEDVIRRSVME
jgi:hypothetical protein